MTNPCPISAAASALFEARAQAGLAKYGVTLANAGHDAPALLKHLAEELADALVYVTALRAAMEWRDPATAPPNKSVLVHIPDAEHYGPGVYRAIRVVFDLPPRWHVTGLNMGRDCDPARIVGWMPLPATEGGE